jgi:hypothetical protein
VHPAACADFLAGDFFFCTNVANIFACKIFTAIRTCEAPTQALSDNLVTALFAYHAVFMVNFEFRVAIFHQAFILWQAFLTNAIPYAKVFIAAIPGGTTVTANRGSANIAGDVVPGPAATWRNSAMPGNCFPAEITDTTFV